MVTTVVRFSLDEILYAGPSHLFRDIADEEAPTLTALAYHTYTFLSQNLVGYHLRLTKLLFTQSKSRLLLHQCIGHRFECNHGSLPKTKFFVPIPQYETRLLTKIYLAALDKKTYQLPFDDSILAITKHPIFPWTASWYGLSISHYGS